MNLDTTVAPAAALLLEDLRLWDPDARPVHCSNCRWALVHGEPNSPMVRCATRHGEPVAHHRLVRRHHPWGFRNASLCEDFDSMDDDAPTTTDSIPDAAALYAESSADKGAGKNHRASV